MCVVVDSKDLALSGLEFDPGYADKVHLTGFAITLVVGVRRNIIQKIFMRDFSTNVKLCVQLKSTYMDVGGLGSSSYLEIFLNSCLVLGRPGIESPPREK